MGGRWSKPYKVLNTKIDQSYGWTLALPTYSVFKTCKVYNTQIHKFLGGRWRYKLIVSLNVYKAYKTKIDNVFRGGRWR